MAEQRDRRLDEVGAGAGGLEQRAEQHEQEDEAGRHPDRHAEHALGGQPHVAHALGQRGAAVGDDVGHVGTEEDVDEEHRGEDHHRQAERATRRFEQQQHADHRRRQIHVGRRARTLGKLLVEQEQVSRTEGRHRRQHPVLHRYVVAWRAFERRIRGKGEEDGEGEVDGARFGVVEHEHAQRERQRRGDPELEQRPRQRHHQQQLGGETGGLASAGVGLGDDLLELFVGQLEAGLVLVFVRAGHEQRLSGS